MGRSLNKYGEKDGNIIESLHIDDGVMIVAAPMSAKG